MEIVIIGLVAAFASLLTFFSGFGLGTILTPVLIIFFPVEIAIALSGIVHLLNNIFKTTLTGRHIDKTVLLKFGIPAILGAFLGAKILLLLPDTTVLYSYTLGDKICQVTPLKITIAFVLFFFALFEVLPVFKKIQFNKDKLIYGGILSGFFGGLTGNQGALRSAFLVRYGLSKDAFIATGVMIACFIDITRLSVYFSGLKEIDLRGNILLLSVAVLSAFSGAYIGNRVLKKITLGFIQGTITVMLILLSICLGIGLI
jgi:uncharacterized membrane protein YfcA